MNSTMKKKEKKKKKKGVIPLQNIVDNAYDY